MKTFPPDFFNVKNFILEQHDFDFLPPGSACSVSCHICYNVNESFMRPMGVSIVSVLENNPELAVTAHIFTDGCSEESLARIEALARQFHCRCLVYLLNMEPFQDFHIKVERFSRITYARIYMPKALQGLARRFIYIDADVMCTASLRPLLEMDLQSAAIGAVAEKPHEIPHRAGFLKLKSGNYFNDGIMVVDVDEWEKQHITEQAFSYQKEPKERFLGQSQDIMNLVFDGRNFFLPKSCNEYGGGEKADSSAVFIHWTGRRKPWQMVVSEYDARWRRYLELSPWENISSALPVKKPENYHDFKEWGLFQKEKGHYAKFLEGLFWYSVLRLRYKSGW